MKTESIVNYLESFSGTYQDVKELTINHFDIDATIQKVDLIDLLNFPYLESLTLINLTLSDKDIAVLTKLKKLSKLNLINCEVISSYVPVDSLNIKHIILDNSNFEEYINNVKLDYLEIKNMDITCREIMTNTLKIDKSNINLKEVNLNNINHLIISEKQYNNHIELLSKLRIKLTVKDNDYDKVVYENEKN